MKETATQITEKKCRSVSKQKLPKLAQIKYNRTSDLAQKTALPPPGSGVYAIFSLFTSTIKK